MHAAEHPEFDRKVIAVLLTACVILTLQNYIFRGGSFEQVPALLDWLGAQAIWPLGSTSGPTTFRTGNWPNCCSGQRAA